MRSILAVESPDQFVDPWRPVAVDEEKARRKEAKRTLKRIKGTLKKLDDDSAWKDPLDSEEFEWMKNLIESGYQHNRPSLFQRMLVLIRHPILLVFLIMVLAMLIQRWLE